MPEEELQKLKGRKVKETAEYFGVPEEMVRLRLKMLSLNKKQDSK
jgi:Zn-dependent peptidase ImmA (M78 family)